MNQNLAEELITMMAEDQRLLQRKRSFRDVLPRRLHSP